MTSAEYKSLSHPKTAHQRAVADYSDDLLEAVIADLARRNLRDYRDNETRWLAERASAARAERRIRSKAIPA